MTILTLLAFLPVLAAADDITGTWHFKLMRFGEQFSDACVQLKVDGTKLTGTLNELKLEGTVENNVLKFTALRPNGEEFGKLEGRLQGDEIKGTVKQGQDEFGWIARRVKV